MNLKITYAANGANSVNIAVQKSDQQLSQKTTHLRLIRPEIDNVKEPVLCSQKEEPLRQFIFQLCQRIDPNTGSIRLTRDEVRRIQRHIKRYKQADLN
ncbi:MAG: hypothetical protein DMF04_01410 [Verrucomicrobia bacterium]|jgi:hypothetical protein|nr:MAG: hypothetical protein DMF04_01410 [Verrucomicrobiota bacterium]